MIISRLFGKSSAGKCLNSIKTKWGCIGENLSKTPGVHSYKTLEGDTVSMTATPSGLEIKRNISPENIEKLKEGKYKGKLFKVYNSIQKNLEFIQSKYNALINSDIIIRNFSLICKNKEYKAFLIYIDGMTDSMSINHFVLNPLMLRNENNTYNDSKMQKPNNPMIIRKVKKTNLADYIYARLIPNNNIFP